MRIIKAAMPFVLAAIPTITAIAWMQAGIAKPIAADYEDQIYKACRQVGGPNVGYYFKDGKAICTNKRGQRLSRQPDFGAIHAFSIF